jgi:protein-S-isoprenylcysteine O-methyltransferase Ste14
MMRWFALIVLVTCVAISGYYRRRARLDSEVIPRRREGGLAMAARGMGGLLVLSIVIAHVVSPARMKWASFDSAPWVLWLGAMLGVLTIPAVLWVFVTLGRNVSETVLTKQRHELVMTGPYQWIRHPLYATSLMLFAAIGLMLTSWVVLLFAILAFVIFRFLVVPVEERHLLEKFGDEYGRYMQRTGRLFPRASRVFHQG